MRRRRVEESRFKTVSYQYPDLDVAATDTHAAYRGHASRRKKETEKGLPRQHQATQTSSTAAQGGGTSNLTASTTTFSPDHANQPNTRATARGNRRGVEGFKRQQSQAHKPPPSSSSSSECHLAQRKHFNQRRTRNRRRKSRLSTLPLKTAVYGECATPQPRADSSGDDGDDADWFDEDNEANMTQWNRGSTPTPLGGGNFWHEDDLERVDRARRLSISGEPIFVTPRVQNAKRYTRTYQHTNFQPYDKGRDEGRRRGGNNCRQVTCRECNIAPFAHVAETTHDKCDHVRETIFAGQQTSKGCLLSHSHKPGVHFYNESDRLYYERRMARRIQVKESPEEYSCESDNEQDWQRILAASINLPADPGRTERWVRTHYPLVVQPLRAESAEDPVLILGEAASPPKRETQTLETRNQQAKRDTSHNNAKKMAQKVKSSAGAFVDSSSEDSSPPLDRNQLQFIPRRASPNQRAPMRSYEEIIKEEKAKRAVSLAPINEPSRYQINQAYYNNTGGEHQANEARLLDLGAHGTQFGHGTKCGHYSLFAQDSIFGHDVFGDDTSEKCEPQTGMNPKCRWCERKEQTVPSDDFDYMLRPRVCSGAHPKYAYQRGERPLPKLPTKTTKKRDICERKCCQPIRNGSGDQTAWTEEFKLAARQRVRAALLRTAGKLDDATGEEKMQFYSCGEGTLTKSSSQMTGNQEIGRTCSSHLRTGRWNEANDTKFNPQIENGSGDQTLPSEELNHASRQRTRTAMFGTTGKFADAAGEEKTQFYSCSSQLSEETGEQPSDGDGCWWSPVSLLLPPMPQKEPQERSKILRSIRSDWFYTDDMAIVPTLQNKTSHNLMLTGGISHHFPTNYLDGSAVILYHPHNQAWFFFGTMPEPRCYHTTVLVGGSIIVAGGLDPLNVTSSGRMQPSSKAFFFSIQNQRWYNMANMHSERAFHAAVGWSDCMIVFGGVGLTGFTSRSAEIYSSKTNQWTLVHPMPKALMGMAAVTVDNSIWIFGGVTRDSEGSSIEDVTYVFDPRTDAWVTRSPMTMRRAFSSAVSVQRDIWLVGGIVNLRPLECTDRIDVLRGAHDSWEPRAALPLPMHSIRIVKTGSELYLVGGQTIVNSPRGEVIVFNRAERRFVKCTETPKTLIGFAAVLLPRASTVLRRYPLSSKATPQERWYAATVIQRAYRHYRNDGTLRFYLKNMRHPSKVVTSREPSMTQWRHTSLNDLVPVHIEKWPPSQPSTTTVNADDGTGEHSTKKYAHYATLRADMDPNLGMLQHMDGSFLKTRLALGLRMTPEWMSSGLRQLKQSQLPCDPCFPVILIIGGLDPRNPLGSSGSAVLKYHPLKDRWMLVNAMPEPRTYHAVAYINDTIFVTGGYSTLNRKSGEMVATKTTFIMNTKTGNWERLPDMLDERACHASIATEGRIIVFGGRGHDGRLLSSVEAYDLKNDKWKRLNSMPKPRMGMTAVAKDGSIWLLGGMSERHNSPTVSEVLLYSLQLDSWSSDSPLRLPRAFSSATLINGNIWLCGGCSTSTEEKHPVSMDSIDVRTQHSEWKKTCTLGVARHSASIATIGSCIFIFGGINSQEWGVLSKSTLIVTDRKAVVSPSPMPQAVSGHAAVALWPSSSRHPISSTKWSDAIFEKHG